MSYEGLILKSDTKTEWLAALRSGKYKQAKQTLCFGGGKFCCLGVLAKVKGVALADEDDDLPEPATDGVRFFAFTTDPVEFCETLLPDSWFKNFLIDLQADKRSSYIEPIKTLQQKLAGMNDGACKFPEIADWIEENL